MAAPIKLTYFAIEGPAEKIRLALTVGGIEFEDDRVTFDKWAELKPKTKYGQLPLMTIGSEVVAQSGAMLRHAGTLANLYPPALLIKIEEVIGLEEDMTRSISPSMYIGMRPHNYGYPEDMPKEEKTKIQLALRERLIAQDGDIPKYLGIFEAMLADDREFICGPLTIADCQLIPRLRHLKKGVLDGIPATVVDAYPKLTAYYNRFHANEKVKAYYDKLAAAAAAASRRVFSISMSCSSSTARR